MGDRIDGPWFSAPFKARIVQRRADVGHIIRAVEDERRVAREPAMCECYGCSNRMSKVDPREALPVVSKWGWLWAVFWPFLFAVLFGGALILAWPRS